MILKGLVAVQLCALALCAPSVDLITSLPGLTSLPSFKQYSGYLQASPSKHFHYWFVESQNKPQSDPVVLWLNGGPGCSSMDGLLSENGPLLIQDGGTLRSNPYSWNKIANVIYLESPAGVGYSYDVKNNLTTDDDMTSLHNYNALVDFFKKFPEFSKNQFFVTGESYGGIYVPTLSVRILQGSFPISFEGFAVGNGLNSRFKNDNSVIFFAYYHGLFGETLQKNLKKHCCKGEWSMQSCTFFVKSATLECLDYVGTAFSYIYHSGLNSYALYLDCYGGYNGSAIRYQQDMKMLFQNLNPVLRSRVINKNFKGKSQRQGLVPPCIDASAATKWLNRVDVRKALHIPSQLPTWTICSTSIEYTSIYNDVTTQYKEVLKHPHVRILVYNGDVDMVCNFLGDEWFVDNLNLPITSERSPWYVMGQVAGFAKTLNKRLTYTTIRGAGHMVPQWAPAYAYAMFKKFINNKSF